MHWAYYSTEPKPIIGPQYLWEPLTPEQLHEKTIECEARNLIARKEVDEKRSQAEIPDTEEFEALKVCYNTGILAVNVNKF